MPSRPSLLDQSSTSSQLQHHHPIQRLYPLLARLTFHVIPGKLEDELGNIYEIIDDLGGKCVRWQDARLILTALKGRPRIARAIGGEAVVSCVRGEPDGRRRRLCSESNGCTRRSDEQSMRRAKGGCPNCPRGRDTCDSGKARQVAGQRRDDGQVRRKTTCNRSTRM